MVFALNVIQLHRHEEYFYQCLKPHTLFREPSRSNNATFLRMFSLRTINIVYYVWNERQQYCGELKSTDSTWPIVSMERFCMNTVPKGWKIQELDCKGPWNPSSLHKHHAGELNQRLHPRMTAWGLWHLHSCFLGSDLTSLVSKSVHKLCSNNLQLEWLGWELEMVLLS